MTEPDTLFNVVFRETFRNQKKTWLDLNHDVLRKQLASAKRFVLDDKFSELLAHLACTPFCVPSERQPDVLDSLRHSAIPPFDVMWVEYDGHAFRRGLLESNNANPGAYTAPKKDVWGNALVKPGPEIIKETGWLITKSEHLVKLQYFMLDDNRNPLCMPFTYTWSLNDWVFPQEIEAYPRPQLFIDTVAGMFAHGVSGLRDGCIGVINHHPVTDRFKVMVQDEATGQEWPVNKLLVEFGGVVRYALAFLATLDSTPKISVEVKPHRGFMGRGQVRQYLDHTTLMLKLPAKQTMSRMAKRLIAQARRGWHEVRPHHRVMHPVFNGKYCARREDHIWSAYDETGHAYCKQCDAKRVWITLPHGRGDPSISVRTHSYAVTRGEL